MNYSLHSIVHGLFAACPRGIRSSLERSVRGRVVRRRLGAEFGGRLFYATPEASLIWALPGAGAHSDEGLARFCREFVQPGAVVWDFGGHLGVFAFAAAHRAGPDGLVLAVEPDPFLSRLMIMSESLRPVGSAPCTVLTCAVGRSPGFATLEIPERSRAANAIAGKSESTQRGGIRQRLDVPIVTVAQLGLHYRPPDVIKMDIEGSELDALLGGEELLAAKRPVMLLEVYAHIREDVTRLLKKWGYRLYDAEEPGGSRREVEAAPHNTLAVPK
jgi:FkbM family methyltransferase